MTQEQKQQAEEVFTIRGFEPRPHSIRNIIGESLKPVKPWVLAIATSGGKTLTVAGKLEYQYKYGYLKSTDRVLIFASDKTILRENFIEQFKFFFTDVPASFSWREVTNSKELKEAIDDGVNVIIMLPQTIRGKQNGKNSRSLQLLKSVKWSWFVLDEAHRWYFKNHITMILNEIKPTYQFLLTGTPFKFNLRKDKFIIDYTTVRKMYELGYLSNVTAQVLHSSVELNQIDYVSVLGNLKEAKHFTNNEVEETLMAVTQQMMKKLKLPLKGYKSVHNITKNTLSVFGKLQKTIIFTHGTQEADVVGIYFNKLGVKTLVSHSNIKGEDPNKTFEDFRTDDEVKILVAVNRGKEGFDFPELYNVVDMTYSQNFEVVMQIFGRVLRKSKNIDEKFFFKVAPKNTSGYFVSWMNAMFMLFEEEWFAKYNGKNGLDIRIPNSLINDGSGKGTKGNRGNGGPAQKGKIKPRNLEFFNSLEFMKENGYFKLDDTLATVASTTLKDVCIEHNLHNFRVVYTEQDLKNASNVYSTKMDLLKNKKGLYGFGNKHNILNKYFKHNVANWDNINDCIDYAKKFNYKNELLKANRTVWTRLKNENLLDDIFPNRAPNPTHSKSHMKKIHNLSKIKCSKAILQYDKNNNFIQEWKSAVDASKEIGLTSAAISRVLTGKSKTSAGFIWKYKE